MLSDIYSYFDSIVSLFPINEIYQKVLLNGITRQFSKGIPIIENKLNWKM